MARRKDHSRAELYDLALAAAREIAEAEGLRGLTARRVAAGIGYSAGTLYNVFANLDALIMHLNGSTLDRLFAALSALPRRGEPDADLRALLDGYVRFTHEHRNLWSILFEYRLPDGHEVPEWYGAKVRRLLGLLEQALAPLFAPDAAAEIERTARVLWSAVHGICSLSSSGRLGVVGALGVTEMTEGLLDTYLAGLRARRESVR